MLEPKTVWKLESKTFRKLEPKTFWKLEPNTYRKLKQKTFRKLKSKTSEGPKKTCPYRVDPQWFQFSRIKNQNSANHSEFYQYFNEFNFSDGPTYFFFLNKSKIQLTIQNFPSISKEAPFAQSHLKPVAEGS